MHAENNKMITVPKEIPQKVFDNLIEKQFQHILPHFTMELVQQLMAMMQGPGLDLDTVLEEFQLRNTQIVIQGDKVTYKMPPANLTTFWVFEQDNYKINSYEHKINWLWVLANLPKVLKVRNQMQQGKSGEATSSLKPKLITAALIAFVIGLVSASIFM